MGILRKHYGSPESHFLTKWGRWLPPSSPKRGELILISFRNLIELYGLRNDTLFALWNVAGLYGLCNNAILEFRNVAELYGLRNNPHFDFQNVARLYGLHNDGC